MAGFPQAVEIVFRAEGGLADDPQDRGGRTNLGITTELWERWRDRLGKPGTAVDACDRTDAYRIYFTDYWTKGKCDGLPWPLSLAHFDSMVQHREAPRLLQRALGVKEDGLIGPATLNAAPPANAVRLAEDLIWTRLAYYRGLSDFPHFGRGWLDRMATLREYVVGIRPLPKVA